MAQLSFPGGLAIIALGSNLPFHGLEGAALFAAALAEVEERGWLVKAQSTPIRTVAWPDPSLPAYWNACAVLDVGQETGAAVLEALLTIERGFGRVRGARNAARTLDLDLIDLRGEIARQAGLELPHPRAHERAFVMGPLAAIAPDWRHPILQRTAAELAAALGATEGAGAVAPGGEVG